MFKWVVALRHNAMDSSVYPPCHTTPHAWSSLSRSATMSPAISISIQDGREIDREEGWVII